MTGSRKRYESYLLRLWSSGEGATIRWHVMLENPHTGERHVFADLDALFGFLTTVIGDSWAEPAMNHRDES